MKSSRYQVLGAPRHGDSAINTPRRALSARSERLDPLPLTRPDRVGGRARACNQVDAVVGVTSNPSIFGKALSQGTGLRRSD